MIENQNLHLLEYNAMWSYSPRLFWKLKWLYYMHIKEVFV